MDDLAKKVTAALGGETPAPEPAPSGKLYRVQVGAYKNRKNAEMKLRQISATGTDCFITDLQEGFYRVQCGAYSIRANAEAKVDSLRYMGFDAIIKEYDV
jgi:N-acetylmuramoyl-L-alanine amidase